MATQTTKATAKQTAFRRASRLFGKKKAVRFLVRAVMYLLLVNLAFIFLYPFLHMVITSLKSYADLIDTSVVWIINSFHWDNYKMAFEILDFGPKLFNSATVTVLSTVGHVFACSLAGYAFARYEYKYMKRLFLLVVVTMVIPAQTLIVPNYMMFGRMGLLNSYIPLILPTFFGYGLKGALFIFLYRQFYLSLPKSLEEAAAIDGCGPVKTYFRIAFPSATASTLVCAVLSMVWHYNDFFEPRFYLTKPDKYLLPQTLPTVLQTLESMMSKPSSLPSIFQTANTKEIYNMALVMACTVLVILPIFAIYCFLQHWFMEGVERSGITGE